MKELITLTNGASAKDISDAIGQFLAEKAKAKAMDEWNTVEHMMAGDFDPDQPRDENGRWTDAGASSASLKDIDEEVRTSDDYIGDSSVEDQVNEFIRYHLGENETWAKCTGFTIESNPKGSKLGDVKAEYEVQVRIPYTETDSDGGSWTSYDYETEYREDTFQVKLKK